MNEHIDHDETMRFNLSESYSLMAQFDDCIMKLADEGEGLSLGFPEIEQVLDSRGYQGGQFIVILAKPKVGKTFLVCNSIGHLMREGKKVLFISIEMNSSTIIPRLLRLEFQCGYDELKQKAIFEPEMIAEVGNRWKNKLFLMDMKEVNLGLINNFVKSFSPDVIFIDYLQLVVDKTSQNEIEKVSKVAKGLADLAQIHDKIVIALSQTAKEDSPGWKMPSSSSGKWSSDIHIAADVLIGMCRPDTDPDCSHGDKGKVILQILESRYGGSSIATPYKYDPLTTKLMHYDKWFAEGSRFGEAR
jgi:replicative DNA helicase